MTTPKMPTADDLLVETMNYWDSRLADSRVPAYIADAAKRREAVIAAVKPLGEVLAKHPEWLTKIGYQSTHAILHNFSDPVRKSASGKEVYELADFEKIVEEHVGLVHSDGHYVGRNGNFYVHDNVVTTSGPYTSSDIVEIKPLIKIEPASSEAEATVSASVKEAEKDIAKLEGKISKGKMAMIGGGVALVAALGSWVWHVTHRKQEQQKQQADVALK